MRDKSAGDPRILAIIVTYYPNDVQLGELLSLLTHQVTSIIIVDNSDTRDNTVFEVVCRGGFSLDRVRIFRFGTNNGIATALNVGLEVAIAEGFDYVVLSDQDSLPAPEMVKNLYKAYSDLARSGLKIGAIGPTFTDLYTSLTHRFQVELAGKVSYGHKSATIDAPHVQTLTLITSGTLIPVDVVRVVGGMREDFFIDHVDNEWCHRVRWFGYKLFGTGWAKMQQRMGGEKFNAWCFRWRLENEYDPLRIYYRLRNFVALVKLNYVDWRWKVRGAVYWSYIVYAHAFYSKRQPIKCFLFAVKGVAHGYLGRMGPYRDI